MNKELNFIKGENFNTESLLDCLKIFLNCEDLVEDKYDSCHSLGPSSEYEVNCEIFTYCYVSKDKKYFVRYEVGQSCNTVFKAVLYQT
jgi:hypothetical protein